VLNNLEVEIYYYFQTTIENLRLLLEHSFEEKSLLLQPVYRMIYSSSITALETFLADAFKYKVVGNVERISRVIKTNDTLKERKYSLEDALEWQTNVESWVVKYLDKIIWHKLELASDLYKEVLNVEFDYRSSLLPMAVRKRHDIVHRNGKTIGGKMLVLTKADVAAVLSDVSDTVRKLQDQLVSV
jgi:hypothetical protein